MLGDATLRSEQLDAFRHDVLAGLAASPKRLPSRWLYDARGSELFEAITKLDEYYLTRAELGILRQHRKEIAAFCRECDVLLEYGAGAGVKSELLLSTLDDPSVYVPIDIAPDFLEQTSLRLDHAFPRLRVRPLVANFARAFTLPEDLPEGRRLGFFPGSTIGNLDTEESAALLERLARQVGPGGRAIIGVDTKKNLDVLLRAYDDKSGVTAAFNLNLLARIDRELGANFALERFRHEVRWNEGDSAIEMHIQSLIAQSVTIAGRTFGFGAGETIHTESSRKYDIAKFQALARANGWRTDRIWQDERALFAVFGLTHVPAAALSKHARRQAPAIRSRGA